MKRLAFVLFIILTLCLPVLAQDATADPSTGLTTQNILIVGAVVIAGLAVLKLPEIFRIIAPLVPADVLKQIVPPAADMVLNAADQTPIVFDEIFLSAALRKMGYTVKKDDTGYHTAQDGSTGETDATLRKPDTESVSAPPTTYTTTPMRITPPPSGPFGG